MLSTKLKFFFFIFFLILAFSCKRKANQNKNTIFFCTTDKFNNKKLIGEYSDKNIFDSYNQKSDSVAFSGNFSLKLTPQKPYAYTISHKLRTGTYDLSFWKFGKTDKIFAVVQYDTLLYYTSNRISQKDSSGWEKISLIFSINKNFNNKKIKFYIWNHSKSTVYVDNFKLQRYNIKNFGINDTIFWMYIGKPQMNKLLEQRKIAFKNGVLTNDKNSWIKAIIFYANKVFKVKMRLKGDWLDHISGKRWSFRIKIKNNAAFKHMKVFSIQKPATRYYIAQWLLYTLFRTQDISAPRYGFVQAQRNDQFLGLYAYEEHFEKQLLESHKRREGPILKNTEDAFWDLIIAHKKSNIWFNYPLYEASKIVPFFSKKTLKNKTLNTEFQIAKNLVYQHKWGLANVSDLFDVKEAAKFVALTNIMQGYHAFRWHNQRYYYNPITSKLEFVDYDNYVGEGVFKMTSRTIFGNFSQNDIPKKPEFIPDYYLFKDSIFVNYYIAYLKKYSRKAFWDSVFNIYNDKIVYFESLIKKQNPNYSFDKQMFYKQAEKIRKILPSYIKKVKDGLYKNIQLTCRKPAFYKDSAIAALLPDYVKIFTQKSNKNTKILKIINFFPAKITLVGYKEKNKKFRIKDTSINSYYSGNYTLSIQINSGKARQLVFSFDNKKFSIPIIAWSKPKVWSPRQELEQNNKFPNEKYYTLKNKNIIFKGTQTIQKIILIPAGYQVIFLAGSKINFTDGGGFISYSDVFIKGTKTKPVIISSTDHSANGFTILQAKNVNFKYAIFDGLNTLNYKGWTLTGGVTIYESKVTIDKCKFINNVCEDDLNTVRCIVNVKNTEFSNTHSDGYDSDFSNGEVDSCQFTNLGNDAIDFSTSNIKISNCTIKKAEDKGVSGGEASHLQVYNTKISSANIAIASKDLTLVEAKNIKIKDCPYGLVAFQKKPEYGEAKIIAEKIYFTDVVQKIMIEQGSHLLLDKKNIKGKYKKVAKKFY
jgi:uncharacterized protein YjbI with pentapeptide repeats